MSDNSINDLQQILKAMPKVKLCINCKFARRWAGDKEGGKVELQGCSLYSVSSGWSDYIPYDENGDPVTSEPSVKLEDMPEDACSGWVDLGVRPGQKSSGKIINNCVIVRSDSTCKNFTPQSK